MKSSYPCVYSTCVHTCAYKIEKDSISAQNKTHQRHTQGCRLSQRALRSCPLYYLYYLFIFSGNVGFLTACGDFTFYILLLKINTRRIFYKLIPAIFGLNIFKSDFILGQQKKESLQSKESLITKLYSCIHKI